MQGAVNAALRKFATGVTAAKLNGEAGEVKQPRDVTHSK
jgi:hypothetical protein